MYFLFAEEDQLKEQAKDFEKMKNMMDLLSSEHIKGKIHSFCQEIVTKMVLL